MVLKVIGIVLILAGVLALVYGGFTYTAGKREARLGPLELSLRERQRVDIPVWAGVGAIAAGTGLILLASRRRG